MGVCSWTEFLHRSDHRKSAIMGRQRTRTELYHYLGENKSNAIHLTHLTLVSLFQSIHSGDGWRVYSLGSCGHTDPGRSGVHLHPGGDQLSSSTSGLCIYFGSVVARMQ